MMDAHVGCSVAALAKAELVVERLHNERSWEGDLHDHPTCPEQRLLRSGILATVLLEVVANVVGAVVESWGCDLEEHWMVRGVRDRSRSGGSPKEGPRIAQQQTRLQSEVIDWMFVWLARGECGSSGLDC